MQEDIWRELQAIKALLSGTLTVTGGGGGTEYTEDAASAANPAGGAVILVREDARAGSLTTTDGDNVAARGNNKGEMYVKDTDVAAALTTLDGRVDGLETLVAATNTLLTTQNGYLDGIEGQLTTIDGRVDGLETLITATNAKLDVQNASVEYETVAASATAQVLGATGAAGDYISGVLIIPATTSPGNVLLLDNATSITIFAGGASSVTNLVPFFVPLGINSVSGAWKITTGANVSVIGVGNFT